MCLNMAGTCAGTWLEHVPEHGWNMCLNMAGTCAGTWLEHVPEHGWNMCRNMAGTCARTWREHVPDKGEGRAHVWIIICCLLIKEMWSSYIHNKEQGWSRLNFSIEVYSMIIKLKPFSESGGEGGRSQKFVIFF